MSVKQVSDQEILSMYLNYDFKNITDKKEILAIMEEYLGHYYKESDTEEVWFTAIKELCDKMGYASNMKEYKENPDHFKGNVADFTTVMRVVLTTSSMTPNLYDIMNILGRDRMLKRLEIFKEKGIILRKLAEYLLHRDH